MTATTPGQYRFEHRLWWEMTRKCASLGVARFARRSSLRSALFASLGQYTAAVQYTDWFWLQYNRYWLNQPVPSPTFQPITQINLKYLCSSIDWCDKEIKSRCLPLGLWFPARFPSTWRSVTTSIQFHVENSILYYGVYTNIPCPALIYLVHKRIQYGLMRFSAAYRLYNNPEISIVSWYII